MRWLQCLALMATLVMSSAALAVEPDEVLINPVLEARARVLSKELRCMVCQNQSIDDSNAPLAKDLRILVRERLTAGDSDQQVLDFLVARYGEFVLLNPRFNWHTGLLWIVPAGVLLFGAIGFLFVFRRSRDGAAALMGSAGQGELTPAEKARLADVLEHSES